MQLLNFSSPEYYAEYFEIQDLENVKLHPAYDQNKPSVLYIHGFRQNVLDESVQTVITAYLSRNDHNVFALDWSNYSSGSYIVQAVPNVVGVSTLKALF